MAVYMNEQELIDHAQLHAELAARARDEGNTALAKELAHIAQVAEVMAARACERYFQVAV
ncbi:MAG: hypothetical protein H6842_01600 [Rhodospirillaceae bacterium]|nr:hypothetical protein [Rhodospirillaceae bacterium]